MKVYKVLNITIALVMLVSFFVVSQPAQAQDSNGGKPAGDYTPRELVVVYKTRSAGAGIWGNGPRDGGKPRRTDDESRPLGVGALRGG